MQLLGQLVLLEHLDSNHVGGIDIRIISILHQIASHVNIGHISVLRCDGEILQALQIV